MKFFASLAFAIFLITAAAPARAENPSPSPAPSEAAPKKKKDKPTEGEESAPEKQFDIPVQEGVPVQGIKIPYYADDGKTLIMTFDAEVARKIDATHLEMENLYIEANADDGKKFYIELPRALFNLETRILNGENNVRIRREDFEIFGETGEFHVKTRFAKIIGNVKMIIYTEKLDQQ